MTLIFQSQYQTFTPAQFVKTFQEHGFIQTKGNANVSANPMAPPVPTNIFSKDDLVVLYNPNENLIMFQIINTLDFNEIYDNTIQKILVSLNYNPSSVGMLGLDCVTQIHEVKSPHNSLTSLVNPKFVEGLNGPETTNGFHVTSLRMTSQGSGEESLSVTFEPLQTNPDASYQLVVVYRSKQNDKFNEFIKLFSTKMIEDLVGEIEKNV